MNVKSTPRLSELHAPPLREYYSRVLAYIATAATIAAGTYVGYFSYDILWMVPYALLYPHLAHHLSLRFKRDHPQRTTLSLLFVDALHCGATLSLLGFSVVPSLMALLIMAFSALVIGGMRYLGLASLIAASSASVSAIKISVARASCTDSVVSSTSELVMP
jgi:hypothetical protein